MHEWLETRKWFRNILRTFPKWSQHPRTGAAILNYRRVQKPRLSQLPLMENLRWPKKWLVSGHFNALETAKQIVLRITSQLPKYLRLSILWNTALIPWDHDHCEMLSRRLEDSWLFLTRAAEHSYEYQIKMLILDSSMDAELRLKCVKIWDFPVFMDFAWLLLVLWVTMESSVDPWPSVTSTLL